MREWHWLRVTGAALLLLTAAGVRAQCVQTAQSISQPGVFPSRMAGPIVANGSILGLAKSDTGTSTPAIFFATIDGSFNQITGDKQVASASINGATALFWTGSEFGLFYLRPDYTLILQRIDPSGNTIGAPISMPHSWSSNDEFDVAWSPALNAYVVAHFVTLGFDLGVSLTTVSPIGTAIYDTILTVFAASPANPRVVPLPDGTIGVLWSRSTIPPPISFLAIVNTVARTVKVTSISNRALSSPRVATSGTEILIIYASPLTGGGSELRYVLADANANILTPDSGLTTGSGLDIAPQSLIWNPTLSEWALVYVDAPIGFNAFPGDSRLRRFASPSGAASDTLLSPDPIHSRLAAPFPIVFMNNGYVGSIQRVNSQAGGSESYLVRLCPFLVMATANPSVARPFVPVTLSASPSGGTPGYSFRWQFGDNDSATGATVQHRYSAAGTYTVTLSGTDAAGATSINRIVVLITTAGRVHAVRH
jgi:hypothetical protein